MRAPPLPISAEIGVLPSLLTVKTFPMTLVSLSSRVEIIKNYGKDLLDVSVRVFNMFWPGEDTPERIAILAEKLTEIET